MTKRFARPGKPRTLTLVVFVMFATGSRSSAQCELMQIIGSDTSCCDHYGQAVAVNGDTILVGSPEDAAPVTGQGSAYVFVLGPGGFARQAKLVAPDGGFVDRFGWSVAVWGDSAIVGMPFDDQPLGNTGSMYVFNRDGTAWSFEAKLRASNPGYEDFFGTRCALYDDTAVVGAPFRADSGRVYVFRRSVGGWSEEAILAPQDVSFGDWFGDAVAIDGETIVASSHRDDDHGDQSGSVYVFERRASRWSETAKLTASDARAGHHFGTSVAILGNTLAVGAERHDLYGANSGAAYVFTRHGTAWSEQARVTGVTVNNHYRFGSAVALSEGRLVVGAVHEGAAYLFEQRGTEWIQTARLETFLQPALDHLGGAAAASGNTVVLASGEPVSNPYSQQAHVFTLDHDGVARYCQSSVNSLGCEPRICTTGIASASSANGFFINASGIVNGTNGMLLYGFTAADQPFLGGTLCVGSPQMRTLMQDSGGEGTIDQCAGTFSFDFNALISAGSDDNLTSGSRIYAQYWYRDPQSPSDPNLTDAVSFTIEP